MNSLFAVLLGFIWGALLGVIIVIDERIRH